MSELKAEKAVNKAPSCARRQYYIKDSFQGNFILRFCLLTILGSLLFGFFIFFFSQHSTTVAIENTKVIVKRTSDFILPILIETFIIMSFFSALIVGLVTLFITHKVVGPVFRLEREINKFKMGKLDVHFKIRKTDYLQSLNQQLSEMAEIYKNKYSRIKENYQKLNFILESQVPEISTQSRGKIKERLKALEEELTFFQGHC